MQQRLQRLPDRIQHHRLRASIGMDAVRLKPVGLVGKALHQKRRQRQFVLFCQFQKRFVELACVGVAVVGRHAHANQQHLCLGLLAGADNGFEIFAHGVDAETAQAVVGAERKQHDGRFVLRQCAVDTVKSAERCFTGDAGIGYRIIDALLLQAFGEKMRPCFFAWQAVAGGQAVAEYQNGA